MHEFLFFAGGVLSAALIAAVTVLPKHRRAETALENSRSELEALRAERGSLLDEVGQLRARANEPRPDIAADNAELRRRMDELADALIHARPAPPPTSDTGQY